MRKLIVFVALVAGCGSCDHGKDARALREAVQQVTAAAETAATRDLTPGEAEALRLASQAALRHASALERTTE